jgi:hypothetical protein
MRMHRLLVCLVTFAGFAIASMPARGQGAAGAGTTSQPARPARPDTSSSSSSTAAATQTEPAIAYHKPTEHEKIRNFAFDAFGPYPMLTAAVSAGIQQAYGTPPEWGQGWDAYGVRLGSNYGIQLITTSTRYALAEAFREDTIYYRCSCRGFFPRLENALISTVTARRGADGHRVFSLAAIGSPYAGTMSATLGWYPSRYEPMDGFRIGNYNLAAHAGQNIALEFIYGGPHTMFGGVHFPGMSSRAKDADQNP